MMPTAYTGRWHFFVFPGEQGLCIEQLDVEDVGFAGDSFCNVFFM